MAHWRRLSLTCLLIAATTALAQTSAPPAPAASRPVARDYATVPTLDDLAAKLTREVGGQWEKGPHDALVYKDRILRGPVSTGPNSAPIEYQVFPFDRGTFGHRLGKTYANADPNRQRLLGWNEFCTVLESRDFSAPQPAATEAVLNALALPQPTAATLETYLAGKEVVELTWVGPRVEKMEETLGVPRSWDDQFMYSAAQDGTPTPSVTLYLSVTPENVKRALKLQAKLQDLGYRLDPVLARVWSCTADAATRAKARQLLPDVLADAEKQVLAAVGAAGAAWNVAKPRPMPEVLKFVTIDAGALGHAHLMVTDISVKKQWELSRNGLWDFDDLHLTYLGLMVEIGYTRPREAGKIDLDKAPREDPVLHQALRRAVEPLVKLEEQLAATRQDGKYVAIGSLGQPLGRFVTICGQRLVKPGADAHAFVVDTIDGRKIQPPEPIELRDGPAALVEGRYVFRGYETVSVVSALETPQGARTGQPPTSFVAPVDWFVVTTVVEQPAKADSPAP